MGNLGRKTEQATLVKFSGCRKRSATPLLSGKKRSRSADGVNRETSPAPPSLPSARSRDGTGGRRTPERDRSPRADHGPTRGDPGPWPHSRRSPPPGASSRPHSLASSSSSFAELDPRRSVPLAGQHPPKKNLSSGQHSREISPPEQTTPPPRFPTRGGTASRSGPASVGQSVRPSVRPPPQDPSPPAPPPQVPDLPPADRTGRQIPVGGRRGARARVDRRLTFVFIHGGYSPAPEGLRDTALPALRSAALPAASYSGGAGSPGRPGPPRPARPAPEPRSWPGSGLRGGGGGTATSARAGGTSGTRGSLSRTARQGTDPPPPRRGSPGKGAGLGPVRGGGGGCLGCRAGAVGCRLGSLAAPQRCARGGGGLSAPRVRDGVCSGCSGASGTVRERPRSSRNSRAWSRC